MKRIKKLMLIMVTLAFVLAGMVSVAGAEEVSGGVGFPADEEGVSEGSEALEEPNAPDDPDGPVEPNGPDEPEIEPEGPDEPDGPEGAGIEGDGSQENPWIIKSWDNLTAVIEEKQGGWLLLSNDIDGESSELVIPDGVTVTIDLNGHTLGCMCIIHGEEETSSLSILSSVTGGKLIVSENIVGIGNLSFEKCEVSAKAIDGSEGSITLKSASVNLGVEAEEAGGFWWGGSDIKLSGNSTMDLNGWYFQLDEAAKIDIEAGSEITGIPSILAYSWDNETQDNLVDFIDTIKDYAVAAGFTLVTNDDYEIIFLNKDEKRVESGSLLGVTVLKENDLDVSFDDLTYNGEAKKPRVTSDGRVLSPQDYDVTYKALSGEHCGELFDECVSSGDYFATVTAKGNYSGTVTVYLEIAKAELTSSGTQIVLADNEYTGEAKEPTVKVEGKELSPQDYDVTYMDASGNPIKECISAGNYTATVTGKGNYNGTVTQQFEIKRAVALYAAPQKPIDGTMDQKHKEKQLGSPKDLNGQELFGTWSFSDNAEYLAAGKKKYPVTFKPDDANYTSITSDVVVSTWGAEKNNGTAENPIYNYVAKDGTTSAEVTGNGIIWLEEESEGLSTWYGLESSKDEFGKGVFDEGSKFWVHWLSKSEDSNEWKDYYDKLDDEHKRLAENQKLWIFLMGVTNPDGNEYTSTFGSPVNLYIQLGTEWDMDDINAVFISDAADEVLSVQTLNEYMLPDGTKVKVAKVGLRHCSPYAIMAISLPDPSPETGDSSRILLWILLAVLSCGAMTCAAVYKRKHRQA